MWIGPIIQIQEIPVEREERNERCSGKVEEKGEGRMEGEKEKKRVKRERNSKLVLGLGEIKSRINNAESLLRNRDYCDIYQDVYMLNNFPEYMDSPLIIATSD